MKKRTLTTRIFRKMKESSSMVLLDFERKGLKEKNIIKLKEKMGILNFQHERFGEGSENLIFYSEDNSPIPETANPYYGYKKPIMSGRGFIKFIHFGIKD